MTMPAPPSAKLRTCLLSAGQMAPNIQAEALRWWLGAQGPGSSPDPAPRELGLLRSRIKANASKRRTRSGLSHRRANRRKSVAAKSDQTTIARAITSLLVLATVNPKISALGIPRVSQPQWDLVLKDQCAGRSGISRK